MWDTPGRLLRLLQLLQSRREWNATALAERLDVAPRTVRRDVDRLRAIGYPVEARPGVYGGYRLTPGASLPPLMFDAEEAVATVLALHAAGAPGSTELAGHTLRALTKLIAVLPTRLRRQADALAGHINYTPRGAVLGHDPVHVDHKTLIEAALACRGRRQATATHRPFRGTTTHRHLEPLQLVGAGGRWYLVAFDLDRHDWRTFRVDRLTDIQPTNRPAMQRTPPSDDITAYVLEGIAHGMQQRRAIVRVHAPRAAIDGWIDPVWGRIEDTPDGECLLHVGADTYAGIARWLLLLDADLTVIEPPELAAEFTALAERATQAAHSTQPHTRQNRHLDTTTGR